MKQLRNIKKVLALVRQSSGRYLPLALLESLLSVLNSGAKVLLPALFVDLLLEKRAEGLFFIAVIAACVFLLDRGYALFKRRMDDERILMNLKLEQLLADKLLRVEYALLDDPNFLDLKSGASFAVSSYKAVQNALGHLTSVVNALILIAVSAGYLIAANPLLLLILLLGMIGQTWLAGRLNEKLSDFFKNLYTINRKFNWFSSLKTDLKYQKDIRLFQMERMILDKTEAYNRETTAIFGRMNDATFQNTFGVTAVNTAALVLCYLVNGVKSLTGFLGPQLGVGQFVLCMSLTGSLSAALNGLSDDLTSAFQMFGYLKPVTELMDIPDEKGWGQAPIDAVETIELRGVSFRYPGAETDALQDISLKIGKGERVAVVGLNGSGKTTLVKLICGLYQPSAGQVLVNGRPLKDYRCEHYLACLATVFQDYRIYDYSVWENVAMAPSADREPIERAIRRAGLTPRISALPNSLDTLLSVQHGDGVLLSGGEQQRLAIARALYKDSSVYLFDEPASSLDAIAEYHTYLQYDEMTRGKTCIYISHRMATTRFCDRIVVLAQGKIVEDGTHPQLLQKEDGLYRELYLHQQEKV